MKPALAAFVVALVVAVGWFGQACFGGHFLVDHTRMIDTYHLATIYARYGAYVADGHFPWWFPEFALGSPVPSLSMYGLLYPPTLLYAVLQVETAWAWLAALHLALAAFGMAGFVHEETGDAVAAATGAVLFAASEFAMSKVLTGHTNLLFPLAWAPVVLWQVARCRRGARGAAPLLALSLALGLLSGHIQTWFYCGPLVLLYAAFRARGDGVPLGRYVASLGVAGVVAAGVTAVQWLPALAITRMGEPPAVEPGLIAAWSPEAHSIAAGAVPGFLGRLGHDAWGGGPYPNELVGVSGLAFVLLGTLAVRRGDWRGWFWMGAALLGLAIAQGPHSVVGRMLNDLPVLAWARTPGRAQMLTLLAGAILASHGVARWRSLATESASAWHRPAIVAAAVTGVVVVAGALVVRAWVVDLPDTLTTAAGERPWSVVWREVALPAVLREFVVLAAVGAALWAASRRLAGGRGAWAIPGVLLVAALVGGMPRAESADARFFHHDWVAKLPEQAQSHRFVLMDWRWPPLELHGGLTTRRTSHVEPPWYERLLATEQQERVWPWLDVGVLFERQRRTSPAVAEAGTGVLARAAPMPARGRVQWFERARVGVPDDEALALMLDGTNELLLADASAPPSGGDAGRGGRALVRIDPGTDPNAIAIEVDAPQPGWLLLADKHYPGWTATVDGAPVIISRAMVALRAVPVPAGRRRVEMRYEPGPVRTALPISMVSLIVLGAWGGLVLVRRAPPTASTPARATQEGERQA